jgi:hypothetical protein
MTRTLRFEIDEAAERFEECGVVAGVEADRGLSSVVELANEGRAGSAAKADALWAPAARRASARIDRGR